MICLDLGAGLTSPPGYIPMGNAHGTAIFPPRANHGIDFAMNWGKTLKELPPLSGVYAIRCEFNGRIYIGSSVNALSRCRDHVSRLRSRTHRNRFLQAAFSEFGEASFSWALLEVCEDDRKRSLRELHYIDTLNTSYSAGGFNLELSPRRGGYDIETRRLLSQNMLGPAHPHRGKKFPEEYGRKVSARVRSQGPAAGSKGVNLDARTKTFIARIYVAGKQIFLGRYPTEAEAALAYNIAARTHYGVGCYLNKVDETAAAPVRRTTRGRPARAEAQNV
jgi:group I intron endonuclease